MPRKSDHTLLLLLAAIFVFNSPFTHWWATLGMPWYTIFVLWLVLIVMVGINQYRGNSHNE